jgi:hypothetical protein
MNRYFWLIAIPTILLSLAVFAYAKARKSSTSISSIGEDCPTIIISCPPELPEAGKTYTVSVKAEGIDNKTKLTYQWPLSTEEGGEGQIVDGQGTPSIKVKINSISQTTTATVKVCGLEEKCQKTASCSFTVS